MKVMLVINGIVSNDMLGKFTLGGGWRGFGLHLRKTLEASLL